VLGWSRWTSPGRRGDLTDLLQREASALLDLHILPANRMEKVAVMALITREVSSSWMCCRRRNRHIASLKKNKDFWNNWQYLNMKIA